MSDRRLPLFVTVLRAGSVRDVSPQILFAAAGPIQPAYEAVEWEATPLGPVDGWSPVLRSAVDLILNTAFPATLLWGGDFVMVYNAAFVELIGDKHPSALGRAARDVFPEAWDIIGPLMAVVLAGEGAVYVEDQPLPLERHGRLEETYFTFSYSPVRDRHGRIEGVLDIAMETTDQVVDHRRLEMLSALRELLGGLNQAEDVLELALPLLRANAHDMPDVEVRPMTEGGAPDGMLELSLGTGDRPALAVRLSEHLAPDDAYLGFLRLIAGSLGQALDRIAARDAERSVSEAIQRSLLTQPLQPDHLQVAVRYLPAADNAQVGGDWYDAFLTPDGALQLVVGDVTGHDGRAAAAMAQVRNLLRGVAYTSGRSPAGVLRDLDEAMHGLAIGVFATAIVARVEQDEEDARHGLRTLRWSNAGHPPPALLTADGRARLLERDADVLLGIGGAPGRADHAVPLAPGDTVVLYTDGLVERRSQGLQARLDWLLARLEQCQDLPAEALCEHLLAGLEGHAEDDVALLVLRLFPQDAPRPVEAGPEVLPADLR
jgi:hypothetical protein